MQVSLLLEEIAKKEQFLGCVIFFNGRVID